jgi:putative ABC transport system permease protein
MILLIPLVLAALGRVGGRLPLVLRYAVRDAARHRTRTVPAVAAVAATVAGVVALGVGLTSDEKENRETYVASLPDGMATVTAYGERPDWAAIRAAVEREAPDADLTELRGLREVSTEEGYSYASVTAPGADFLLEGYGSSLGASVLVSDSALPGVLMGIGDGESARAEAALEAGGIVAFRSVTVPVDAETATLRFESYDNVSGTPLETKEAVLPATYVAVPTGWVGPAAVVSSRGARELGVEPAVVSLVAGRDQVDREAQEAIDEVLGGLDDTASLYVERGYETDDATLIAQLILIGLGGVLMLGGTLTATFLALSDARPDLATLSAVGASPRARRGVAAAYAVVVGFVGALLGAAVGFIPGIAVTYPLTAPDYTATGPFLDVPWLMVLGLVLVLPLLTAGVVGLFARSRLPLVARLD